MEAHYEYSRKVISLLLKQLRTDEDFKNGKKVNVKKVCHLPKRPDIPKVDLKDLIPEEEEESEEEADRNTDTLSNLMTLQTPNKHLTNTQSVKLEPMVTNRIKSVWEFVCVCLVW